MGHRQRWYVADMVYEVTIRTLFGQFWLRPDPACRAIIDDYVHGNIARQLNDLRGREGVFWGRRGSVIAVDSSRRGLESQPTGSWPTGSWRQATC